MTTDDEVLQQLGRATQPEAAPTPELPEGTELPYVLHCSASDGSVMILGEIISYGAEFEVTEKLVREQGAAAARVIELVEDPREQRRMFGSVRLRRGGWPTGVPRILIGSRKWQMDREAAYARADRLRDPRESEIAQRAAKAEYGARVGPPAPHEPQYGEHGYADADQ